MKKKEFHILLSNYTALTREEGNALLSLKNEFPYSQVIHCLAARAAQDNQLPGKEEQLHLAAIYTTDRGVFKTIMTEPGQERKSSTVHEDSHQEDLIDTLSASPVAEVQTVTDSGETKEVQVIAESMQPQHASIVLQGTFTDDSIYEEIKHDLERLRELKHEFEETVKQIENNTLSSASEDESSQKKKKPIDPTEELLTEIKSSKKKVSPEGPKQKEQIEIIDQFIKTQPTIKGKVAVEKSLPKDDLSDNNLIYNENIISETLAEILIKQGKKDKAIDVLKKLIWKFPQKKAYFAAQIEDLKK